jgi:hypothetical protein
MSHTNRTAIAVHPSSDPTWMILAFAAVLVVLLVFGLLHAGRQFWQLSAAPDASGVRS